MEVGKGGLGSGGISNSVNDKNKEKSVKIKNKSIWLIHKLRSRL